MDSSFGAFPHRRANLLNRAELSMPALFRGDRISLTGQVLVNYSVAARSRASITPRELPRGGDPGFQEVHGVPFSEGRKAWEPGSR